MKAEDASGGSAGKMHQELPACRGSRLSVMSHSQRASFETGGIELLSEVGNPEASVELGELERFEGGG